MSTPSAPCAATIGTSTTVIAPVGPETCTWLPPKIAATVPATMAVSHAGGDTEREREGEGDHPDGDPGEEVSSRGAQHRAEVPRARTHRVEP